MIRTLNAFKSRWLLCVVGFAALTLACHAAEPFAGRWEGVVHIPGNELNVVIDLAPASNGSWAGSITVPGLNTKGLPLKDLIIKGSDASFAIKTSPARGLEARLKAHLNGHSSLTGQFSQAGNTAPFELKQTGPPQVETPRRSTAITKEIEGEWVGEFQLLGYSRKVTIKLRNSGDGAAAEFVVVGKRVNNLPVDLVTQEGTLVDVHSSEIGAVFEGRFQKETGELNGTFSQGPFEVPLVMKKAADANKNGNDSQAATPNAQPSEPAGQTPNAQ